MTPSLSPAALLELVAAEAPEVAPQIERAIGVPPAPIRLARGVRQEMIETYVRRRALLAEKGIDVAGLDVLLEGLRSHADPYVLGFSVIDEGQHYLVILDEDASRVVALLVHPLPEES